MFDIPVSVKNLRFFRAALENKTTVRKIARAIKDYAITVANKIGIEGNLAKTYKLQHQDYQVEELHWVTFKLFRKIRLQKMPEQVKK